MQSVPCRYGFGNKAPRDFDATVVKLEKLLTERGFQIMTRIDVGTHLNDNFDINFRRYIIFGACKMEYARMAFGADINIGLELPCNIIIYENDDGEVTVMAKDPALVMDRVDHPQALAAAIQLME
jgi:uncharacterized protein (DUF302 family)